jgi:hypothetical protein
MTLSLAMAGILIIGGAVMQNINCVLTGCLLLGLAGCTETIRNQIKCSHNVFLAEMRDQKRDYDETRGGQGE